MIDYMYRGYPIEFNFRGEREFVVFHKGNDHVFNNLKDAQNFIDEVYPE